MKNDGYGRRPAESREEVARRRADLNVGELDASASPLHHIDECGARGYTSPAVSAGCEGETKTAAMWPSTVYDSA